MNRPVLFMQRASGHLKNFVDELVRVSRFGALGIVLNLLAFVTYYVAVVFFKSDPFFSVLWIWPFYVVISFFAQQKFVFGTKKYTWVEGFKFCFFYLKLYSFNLFGIYVLVEIAKVDPVLSQVLLVILGGAISYLSFKMLFLK